MIPFVLAINQRTRRTNQQFGNTHPPTRIVGGSPGIGFFCRHIDRVDDALRRLQEAVPEAKYQPAGYKVDYCSHAAEANLEQLLSAVTEQGTKLLGHIGHMAARPNLRAGYTSSITISSGPVAERPIPGVIHYAGYTTAQQVIARSLALNLAPLRVNCVAPGATETALWEEQRDAIRAEYRKTSLLEKAGRPEEVAQACHYLIKNTDVTGPL
ncbi:uncharacterized protein J7T54_003688 [Emericellopsis cladophorae]|uniref:Uncharacterized protein n=1 Tax=Emericellopsis cladophorae TaxID=2686198 RepID=A0A9P9XUA4_9HYPO|nr:uncharacterized protein J7T54_003688 [Emericellopsis cladophorae]KAI6777693.1 hypothetical protein J7T54_003688 [Emericellopsis cladophorae]